MASGSTGKSASAVRLAGHPRQLPAVKQRHLADARRFMPVVDLQQYVLDRCGDTGNRRRKRHDRFNRVTAVFKKPRHPFSNGHQDR
jgi:hypothetical protein